MAYGTETISRVDKISGSKRFCNRSQIAGNRDVEIDMAAGPSELMVIADDSANCRFIAADLLSRQTWSDSQLFLLTSSKNIALGVLENLPISYNPRCEVAQSSCQRQDRNS